MHHPVSVYFFRSIETGGGFQRLDELAFPFPSYDIFFPLSGGHSSFRQNGTLRCSTLGLSNKNGKYKKSCRTIGIRFLLRIVGQYLQFVIAPALQKTGKHGKKKMPFKVSGLLRDLLIEARRLSYFGLFFILVYFLTAYKITENCSKYPSRLSKGLKLRGELSEQKRGNLSER